VPTAPWNRARAGGAAGPATQADGLQLGDGFTVGVTAGVGVGVRVATGVGVMTGVGVGVRVATGVGVTTGVCVAAGVGVAHTPPLKISIDVTKPVPVLSYPPIR
jgi:hypothetical protein